MPATYCEMSADRDGLTRIVAIGLTIKEVKSLLAEKRTVIVVNLPSYLIGKASHARQKSASTGNDRNGNDPSEGNKRYVRVRGSRGQFRSSDTVRTEDVV